MIASYLRAQRGDTSLPEKLTMTFEKVQDMRYGENPHQNAAFYMEVGQTVYLYAIGNEARRRNKDNLIVEYKIKTIGKKYITVWKNQNDRYCERFYKDTLSHVYNVGGQDWIFFLSMDDIEKSKRKTFLYDEIERGFRRNIKLSLDELEAIYFIVEKHLK
jgi:thioredoxin-related protein